MRTPADIVFDEATHTYRVAGEVWPSVTRVLAPITNFDGVPAHLLAAAAEFGTHVHAAIHLYNQGQLDRAALDPALAPYLDAWQLLLRETGAVVVESERMVLSEQHCYCGTIDSVVHWKRRRVLFDIKTTATPPASAGPQTAAYAEAMGASYMPRYVAHLRGDGSYRLIPQTDARDWPVFLSCLNIWRFNNAR